VENPQGKRIKVILKRMGCFGAFALENPPQIWQPPPFE
jgi:hypothetical protein